MFTLLQKPALDMIERTTREICDRFNQSFWNNMARFAKEKHDERKQQDTCFSR
jgi:hypothetical protein